MPDGDCTERWLPVLGWTSWYSVSDRGRVRNDRDRRMGHSPAGRILKPDRNKFGYLRVTLNRSGFRRRYWVHRLVLARFVGALPAGMQTNHKNGVKHDNRLGNLEYVTPKGNMRHAMTILGFDPRAQQHPPQPGELNGRHVLVESEIRRIRHLVGQGVSQQRVAEFFGVGQTQISRIVRREHWRHVA